jgi:plastocyanin
LKWWLAGTVSAFAVGAVSYAPQASPQRHVIEIRELKFVPEVVEVKPGDTIVWINRDIFPHTATSVKKGIFDSGTLSLGDSLRHIVKKESAGDYICALHPVMKGRLILR